MIRLQHGLTDLSDRVVIYALIDPRDLEIRYIGLSRREHPSLRYMDHIQDGFRRLGIKGEWIYELLTVGLTPTLFILDVVKDVSRWEVSPAERDQLKTPGSIEYDYIAEGFRLGLRLTNGNGDTARRGGEEERKAFIALLRRRRLSLRAEERRASLRETERARKHALLEPPKPTIARPPGPQVAAGASRPTRLRGGMIPRYSRVRIDVRDTPIGLDRQPTDLWYCAWASQMVSEDGEFRVQGWGTMNLADVNVRWRPCHLVSSGRLKSPHP
jgi:hypothetical protein